MMDKTEGRRNFGYRKQMDWAGKQALRDRYGNGRYGTVAGHTERWRQFVAWCRSERGIRDARRVDRGFWNTTAGSNGSTGRGFGQRVCAARSRPGGQFSNRRQRRAKDRDRVDSVRRAGKNGESHQAVRREALVPTARHTTERAD